MDHGTGGLSAKHFIMFLCLAPLLLAFWCWQHKLLAFLQIIKALSSAELGISALIKVRMCFFFNILLFKHRDKYYILIPSG